MHSAAERNRTLVCLAILNQELQHFDWTGVRNRVVFAFIFLNEIGKYVEIAVRSAAAPLVCNEFINNTCGFVQFALRSDRTQWKTANQLIILVANHTLHITAASLAPL